MLYGQNISATNYCITGLTVSTNYNISVRARDKNGNVSPGVNFEQQTGNITESFVKGGLILLQENISSPTSIINPDSYFMGNEPFSLSFTARVLKHRELLGRFTLGGSINKIRFHRDGNNSFKFDLWGENDSSLTFQSPGYPDESRF